MNPGVALVVAVVLLLANGYFVAAEFALVAARNTRLQEMAEAGDRRAAMALESARELPLTLAGAQLGITMASLGLGYVAEPAVGSGVESLLHVADLPSGLEHTLALAIALAIVVVAHMVIGEMAPKNIAIAEPERTALRLARSIRLYMRMFRPVIRFLNGIANVLLAPFGVRPGDELVAAHTADELAVMLGESLREGLVDEDAHRLLTRALHFPERKVSSLMVPRDRIVALAATATPAGLLDAMNESGHSRFPVYGRDLDDIVGFVHAKALLEVDNDAWGEPIPSRCVHRMLVLNPDRLLPDAMVQMRRAGIHVAIVLDQRGTTTGLVTLEDLLEALVGDIRDEYDRLPRDLRL